MAKVTNYAEVEAEVRRQLAETEWSMVDVLGMDLTTLAVINIYMTNDYCSGFGQDFLPGVSIISSPYRISVILGAKASNYKDDNNICLYQSLADDIHEILIVMQAAYDRIQ